MARNESNQDRTSRLTSLKKDSFKYMPFFCEENCWHLGNDLVSQGVPVEQLSVLLFFLPGGFVPLFNQGGCEADSPVFWDYHVVLKYDRSKAKSYILDFNSKLPFVTPTAQYLMNTFPSPTLLPLQFQFWVRSVPVRDYLDRFHSDRSHMLSEKGEPLHPFPDWPCILINDECLRIRLRDFISLTEELTISTGVKSYADFLGENNG